MQSREHSIHLRSGRTGNVQTELKGYFQRRSKNVPRADKRAIEPALKTVDKQRDKSFPLTNKGSRRCIDFKLLLRLETNQISEAPAKRAKMRGLKRTQHMLNELESLSQNIGRLIKISERHHQAHDALSQQLDQLRSEFALAQQELANVREERDALVAERDSLSAKIDDAQVRLNAILEKLPRAKNAPEPDNQLALLPPDASSEPDTAEAANGALHEESHHHGEKA